MMTNCSLHEYIGKLVMTEIFYDVGLKRGLMDFIPGGITLPRLGSHSCAVLPKSSVCSSWPIPVPPSLHGDENNKSSSCSVNTVPSALPVSQELASYSLLHMCGCSSVQGDEPPQCDIPVRYTGRLHVILIARLTP